MKPLAGLSGVIGTLALAGAAWLVGGALLGAFDGPGGMAVVALGVWAGMLAGAGFALGLASAGLARWRGAALPTAGKAGLWASGAALGVLAFALL